MMYNEDVPTEAIVKNLIIERDRYKQEAGRLKTELHNKENAIRAFKKWQREVTQRHISQWLNEAMTIEDPVLSLETVNKIKILVKAASKLSTAKSREIAFAKSVKELMEDEAIRELINL